MIVSDIKAIELTLYLPYWTINKITTVTDLEKMPPII